VGHFYVHITPSSGSLLHAAQQEEWTAAGEETEETQVRDQPDCLSQDIIAQIVCNLTERDSIGRRKIFFSGFGQKPGTLLFHGVSGDTGFVPVQQCSYLSNAAR
jgi:hypothetical protein